MATELQLTNLTNTAAQVSGLSTKLIALLRAVRADPDSPKFDEQLAILQSEFTGAASALFETHVSIEAGMRALDSVATVKPLIVGIGDSIMAGYMPGDGARNHLVQDKSFLKELKSIGAVITAAVGGATTELAKNNQLYWLAPLNPQVVVIMLGTNDAVYQIDHATSLANVDAMIQKWPSAKVVLVSPPRWDSNLDPWLLTWSNNLRAHALLRNVLFVDGFTASAAGWQCHPEDHHPCEPGHRALGNLVASAVRNALT